MKIFTQKINFHCLFHDNLTFCEISDFFADILETMETLGYFGGAVNGQKGGGGEIFAVSTLFSCLVLDLPPNKCQKRNPIGQEDSQ